MGKIKKMEFVQSNMSALHILRTYALASFSFTFRPQANVLLRATDSGNNRSPFATSKGETNSTAKLLKK